MNFELHDYGNSAYLSANGKNVMYVDLDNKECKMRDFYYTYMDMRSVSQAAEYVSRGIMDGWSLKRIADFFDAKYVDHTSRDGDFRIFKSGTSVNIDRYDDGSYSGIWHYDKETKETIFYYLKAESAEMNRIMKFIAKAGKLLEDGDPKAIAAQLKVAYMEDNS